MAYIPRQLAPTSGFNLNSVPQQPKSSSGPKPSVSFKGPRVPRANPMARETNPLVGKVNFKDWDVDPMRIMKHLLDKEMVADEHSGLVSNSRHSAQ